MFVCQRQRLLAAAPGSASKQAQRLKPAFAGSHHLHGVSAKGEVSIPVYSKQTGLLVERDSGDVTGAVLEGDLRVSVGLPSLVRGEESNVAFARSNGKTFPVSPDLDSIDVRLEPMLQFVNRYCTLEDIEVVSVGFTEGSVGREVGDEVVKQDRAQDAALGDARTDNPPRRVDPLIQNPTLSSPKVGGNPTLEAGIEWRVVDFVEEKSVVNSIERLADVDGD